MSDVLAHSYAADLHIHSRYSIATSPDLVPELLEFWAQAKGIRVLGSGDCVHPAWSRELEEKLEPAGEGLFRLKPGLRPVPDRRPFPLATEQPVSFLLSGEVSGIYRKAGRVRKVHSIVLLPDFPSLFRLQAALDKIGNISSDGRPILGLDARDLLEMVLESGDGAFLIPAHIWTPWFSVLGSKSGFDSIEECFGDLSGEIFALETGLSSNPPMNWACSRLDSFFLVSNSDAHSPGKLARNATLFHGEPGFQRIRRSLQSGAGLAGTIDLYPQEGKYHFDGHRKCGVCWNPLQTLEHEGACPVCGKQVTRGVLHRVACLADRARPETAPNRRPFHSLTSLADLLAEIMGCGSGSKKVTREYARLLGSLGSELDILLHLPVDQVRSKGGEALAMGVERLRQGAVQLEEGFDGQFGRVRVFQPGELEALGHRELFAGGRRNQADRPLQVPLLNFDLKRFQEIQREQQTQKQSSVPVQEQQAASGSSVPKREGTPMAGAQGFGVRDAAPRPTSVPGPEALSPLQRQAVEQGEGVIVVLSGPGSGKTRVLTERIVYLIRQRKVPAATILALTFSTKAAAEMGARLQDRLWPPLPQVCTFHALGHALLRDHAQAAGLRSDFVILEEEERLLILLQLLKQTGQTTRSPRALLRDLEQARQGRPCSEQAAALLPRYETELVQFNACSLGDLISVPCRLLQQDPALREQYQQRYRHILVDEFQDIDPGQYNLLRFLCPRHNANLFVIGDPDQAIYGFRGADPELMRTLHRDYPGTRTLDLDRSYRCPDTLLRAAGQVLGGRHELAGLQGGPRIHIQVCRSARSEADWIAARIEDMLGGVRSFSLDSGMSDGASDFGEPGFGDFAVLCRTSLLFPALEEAFANHGIAHQCVDTLPFFRKPPLAPVYLALRRALYFSQPAQEQEHLPALDEAQQAALQAVRPLLERNLPLARVVEEAGQSLDMDALACRRLATVLVPFGNNYRAGLEELSRRRGNDDFDPRAEAVTLCTMHASKGLEFRVVFIAGCEQALLPFQLFETPTAKALAEEERLFYVAVTRSSGTLYLTRAQQRRLKGRNLRSPASPFLERIEAGLLVHARRAERPPPPGSGQLDLFS